MQIDSMPAACQVHPAGTPKGQGQNYVYYKLERIISLCMEQKHIFKKTTPIFGKKKKKENQLVRKSKHSTYLYQSKTFTCGWTKKPIGYIMLFMIKFSPIF